MGPLAERWVLPLSSRPAMREVREWIRRLLAGCVGDEALEDVLLVAVELVTNAEVHTRSPRRLVLSYQDGSVGIEVADGDPTPPELIPPSKSRPGGRGVFLMNAIAVNWGVRHEGHGKAVWARLRSTFRESGR
ncbi:ATP-binding protein [Kibdelosporangium lantanae]|uniref:ATP-binding protein n=1 Tax=Kibdelosporangium lantanae TaxID=1497396 RepID=A0ABW3M6W7_9PSEU